ncbi:RusA family crossover junction endodeoxyribonuclease [Methylobacterium sp. JK268]
MRATSRRSRQAPSGFIALHAPLRPARDEVVVRLPVPPSVNALHAHGGRGGPRRSDAYRRWIAAAGWRLQAQRPGRVEGPYAIHLALPEASRCDLGNLEKAVSDLLQAHGVVTNDRKARDIRLTWQAQEPEVVVTVRAVALPLLDVPRAS